MIRSKCIALLLSAAVILVFAGSAMAYYTPVQAKTTQGEKFVWQILDDLLGTTTTQGDVNQTSGSPVPRIPDSWDQIWKDGTTDVMFTALWWGGANQPDTPQHLFGYTLDGGGKNQVFDTKASGVDLGYTTNITVGSGAVRWYANNKGNGITAWSDESKNTVPVTTALGIYDRMVTFPVASGTTINPYGTLTEDFIAGDEAYLLFFDTGTTDGDYNDLVVYVEGVHPVPEPGTLLLLGSGLAGLGGFARLKLRRRRNS